MMEIFICRIGTHVQMTIIEGLFHSPQTLIGHVKKGSGSLIRPPGVTTVKWSQIGAALTFLSNTPSLLSPLCLVSCYLLEGCVTVLSDQLDVSRGDKTVRTAKSTSPEKDDMVTSASTGVRLGNLYRLQVMPSRFCSSGLSVDFIAIFQQATSQATLLVWL